MNLYYSQEQQVKFEKPWSKNDHPPPITTAGQQTWKLTLQPIDRIQLPETIMKRKGKGQFIPTLQPSQSQKEFYKNEILLKENQQQHYQDYYQIDENEKKNLIQHQDVLKNFLATTQQEKQHLLEFIDNRQRKCFSFSKYLTNRFKTIGEEEEIAQIQRQDLSLIKVLSSMPNFKMEKLYEMKIQTINNLQKLVKSSQSQSQKFLMPKMPKFQQLRRDSLGEQKIQSKIISKSKTRPSELDDSNDQIKIPSIRIGAEFFDKQSESSHSVKSVNRMINFRVKDQNELASTLNSRIQTVHKRQGQEKPKVVILTERNRRNIFKISEKLQYRFGNSTKPIFKNQEENDIMEVFKRQNRKNNFFQFQDYFYQNYQQNNKGLQTKLSKSVQELNDKFESNIKRQIDQLDKKKRFVKSRSPISRDQSLEN